jgi:hypothetical protein
MTRSASIALTAALLISAAAHADGVKKKTLACRVSYAKHHALKEDEHGVTDIKVLVTTGAVNGHPIFMIGASGDNHSPISVLMMVGGAPDAHAADFGVSTNQSTDSIWKISRQATAEKEALTIDRVSGGIEYSYEVSDQGQVYQFAKFSGTCDKALEPKLAF